VQDNNKKKIVYKSANSVVSQLVSGKIRAYREINYIKRAEGNIKLQHPVVSSAQKLNNWNMGHRNFTFFFFDVTRRIQTKG